MGFVDRPSVLAGLAPGARLAGLKGSGAAKKPAVPAAMSFAGGASANAKSLNEFRNDRTRMRADRGVVAWAGTTPVLGGVPRPRHPSGSFPPTQTSLSNPDERRHPMRFRIPKQSKPTKERIDVKLELEVLKKLDRYCQ